MHINACWRVPTTDKGNSLVATGRAAPDKFRLRPLMSFGMILNDAPCTNLITMQSPCEGRTAPSAMPVECSPRPSSISAARSTLLRCWSHSLSHAPKLSCLQRFHRQLGVQTLWTTPRSAAHGYKLRHTSHARSNCAIAETRGRTYQRIQVRVHPTIGHTGELHTDAV